MVMTFARFGEYPPLSSHSTRLCRCSTLVSVSRLIRDSKSSSSVVSGSIVVFSVARCGIDCHLALRKNGEIVSDIAEAECIA
jgi:hypothetical protein